MPVLTVHMGDMNGYIFEICENLMRQYESDIDPFNLGLTMDLVKILTFFLREHHLTSYKISSILRSENKRIDYKNVHKKVWKLRDLNLIKVWKVDARHHGAIYYRLTSYGLFRLLKYPEVHRIEMKKLLGYYGNDAALKIFLYPYFKRETLMELDGIVAQDFFSYLEDCYDVIYFQFMALRDNIEKKNLSFIIPQWNSFVQKMLRPKVMNLCFQIAMNYCLFKNDHIIGESYIKHNKIISQDEKFTRLLLDTEKNIRDYIQEFRS